MVERKAQGAEELVRSLGDRTEEGDRKRVEEFSEKMVLKWQRGRSEYGPEMKLDPFEEAMDECIDLSNYSLEIYFRLKRLREKMERLEAVLEQTSSEGLPS